MANKMIRTSANPNAYSDAAMNDVFVNPSFSKRGWWRVTVREAGNSFNLKSEHKTEDAALKAATKLATKLHPWANY